MSTAATTKTQWGDQEVDEAFVRRAVDQAESNALRVALYQATRDPEVLDLKMEKVTLRRGALVKNVIADEDLPKLKEKAVEFLLERADSFQETVPSPEEQKDLIELILGERVDDRYIESRRPLLGFEEFPCFQTEWPGGSKPEIPTDFKVLVIGAGFSGVCTGTQLNLLGIPYEIWEKRGDVGGTWATNRYPDVRVDTMSTTYQLSFVKKYPWVEHFAPGAQVRQYIEDTAREFDVLDKVRYNTEVTSLTWNEQDSVWEVEAVRDGQPISTRANVVIAGTGLFNAPKSMGVKGEADFKGDILHTARWPEEYSFKGKRVAVVGNGSTGVQLLKKVASEADHVSVIVRTPQWITPREYYGEPVTPELQWLIQRMPYYANWDRFAWSAPNTLMDLFVPDPEWKAKGGLFSPGNDALRAALTEYIKEETGFDESLYSKLIPNYPPWARRMIVDNDWYRTLAKDHVELVTAGVDHLEENAIVTTDGQRIEVDAIVSSTGFAVTDYLFPIKVTGKGGVDLREMWDADPKGPRAYQSMTVPGFPNLFIFYGPNSQGGSIFPVKMELWASYAGGLIAQALEAGVKEFEVKQSVFDEHHETLDGRTQNMIWMDPDSKDKNYYVYRDRVQVMAAWSAEETWEELTHPRLTDYDTR